MNSPSFPQAEVIHRFQATCGDDPVGSAIASKVILGSEQRIETTERVHVWDLDPLTHDS